jgi:DNA invertase Pin-like site-specific DNA recombinase
MRLGLYARVSTKDQDPEGQLRELREYAARAGASAVEFIDHGISGRRARRPALDRLLRALRRRELDGVVVVRLDRLARSLAHMAQLGEELQGLGVQLVSLRESIDTSTAAGRAMFGMCGVFAQLEADLVRERTLAGLALARARGRRLGRPPLASQRDRARIARLRDAGHSIRGIAQVTGLGRGVVERALRGAR